MKSYKMVKNGNCYIKFEVDEKEGVVRISWCNGKMRMWQQKDAIIFINQARSRWRQYIDEGYERVR